MKRALSLITAIAVAFTIAACATPGSTTSEVEIRRGVVEQITAVQIDSNHHAGVGAVVGALAGVGIGSLIGAGTGRDVAMVAGALGGAWAGNEVQKKHDAPVSGQQVIVRTSSGVLVSVTQPGVSGLRNGQRVYIEGNGDGARVVAQ
jgi:outer membrane lipoprotein SlyB